MTRMTRQMAASLARRTDARTIEEARWWLIDCHPDDEDVIAEFTPAEVVYYTSREYGGGWSAFVADGQTDEDL